MPSNKNKVIQLFPNETEKRKKFDKSGTAPSNLLIKQTTEVKVNYIHGETTILKSTVEVTTIR